MASNQGLNSSLYRKYRPQNFSEVFGQDQVIIPLKNALDNNHITHAYIFSGPRGCGKTTCARIFAKCLNCAQGPTSNPCNKCESCLDLSAGGKGSLDVLEIDAASHGSVDDARELNNQAMLAPMRDRYKVFIFDEAHMITTQGFNALLKLVEEPPEHVKFIFATTNPEKMIPTIISRTHHYPFNLVPDAILMPYLAELCQKEKVEVEPGVLQLVITVGAGSVRDSLSVLDQLIISAENGSISYKSASMLLGFAPRTLIDKFFTQIINTATNTISDDKSKQNLAQCLLSIGEEVVASGIEIERFLGEIVENLSTTLAIAYNFSDDPRLNALPAQLKEILTDLSAKVAINKLYRLIEICLKSLENLKGNTPHIIHLNLFMAQIIETLLPENNENKAKQDRVKPIEVQTTKDFSAPKPTIASSPSVAIKKVNKPDKPTLTDKSPDEIKILFYNNVWDKALAIFNEKAKIMYHFFNDFYRFNSLKDGILRLDSKTKDGADRYQNANSQGKDFANKVFSKLLGETVEVKVVFPADEQEQNSSTKKDNDPFDEIPFDDFV